MMKKNDLHILDWLLSSGKSVAPESCSEFSAFRQTFLNESLSWGTPVERAITGGFLSGCAAFAFAAGYCSALQCLVPSLPADTIACFCITEEGGGHPRAIRSQLAPSDKGNGRGKTFTLNGKKKFVTCAAEADLFLVAASTGIDDDGKNKIRMLKIDSKAPGIRITPMKGLHLVPEISHGEIAFSNVFVHEMDFLPGDGYIDYIKPFRTIEDLHVSAGILGYLFKNACQYAWDREIRERILGRIVMIKSLASESPGAPAIHIALGNALRQIKDLLEALDPFWEQVGGEAKAAWDRDKILMNIADKARDRRLQTAWEFYEKRRS